MSFYLPIKTHFAHSFLSSMASNTRTRIKIPVSTYFIRRSHVTGIAYYCTTLHFLFCFWSAQLYHISQISNNLHQTSRLLFITSTVLPQYRITSTVFHHKAKHID